MVLSGKILNNFYLRNIALLCVLISPALMHSVRYGISAHQDLIYEAISTVLLYMLFLLHNRIFYEKLVPGGRYFAYIAGTLLSVYMMHKLLVALSAWLYQTIPEYSIWKWLSIFWVDLVYIYAGFAVYTAFKNKKQQDEANKLALIKKELELNRLKEQLQPHFLFNALNNIYSYNLEGNKKGNELILKLSEQMRYIMQHADLDVIDIVEEVTFIDNYIEFEKERLGERCNIVFKKDIRKKDCKVPPLIFFPFIDNAFKHGTNTIGRTEVFMDIKVLEDKILFHIKNSIFNRSTITSTNIGLANVKRRLELLYPGRHSLIISDNGVLYNVELILDVRK